MWNKRLSVSDHPHNIAGKEANIEPNTIEQGNRTTPDPLYDSKRSPFDRGLNPRIRVALPSFFVAKSPASVPAANFWSAIPG